MKTLLVSRPVDARHLSASGGVLALLGLPPGHAMRVAALRYATAAADAPGLKREPLAGVADAEVVHLDGTPLVVIRRERPKKAGPSVAVVLWHEAFVELGTDGAIPVDVVEPRAAEQLQ